MATISVERIMNRVSLVVDCENDAETEQVYQMFVQQILDGRSIHFRIEDAETAP